MLAEIPFHRHSIFALGQCNGYQLWRASRDQHHEVEPMEET